MKRTFVLASAAVAVLCSPYYATAGPPADPYDGGPILFDSGTLVGLHGPPLDAVVMLASGPSFAAGMVTISVDFVDQLEELSYAMLLAGVDNDRLPRKGSQDGMIALVHDPTIRFGRRGGVIRLHGRTVDRQREGADGKAPARRPGGGGGYVQSLTVSNDNVRRRIAA